MNLETNGLRKQLREAIEVNAKLRAENMELALALTDALKRIGSPTAESVDYAVRLAKSGHYEMAQKMEAEIMSLRNQLAALTAR